MAKSKIYKVYAGPFEKKDKALKQAVNAQKIVADSNITISNGKYYVNICELNNKKNADTLKATLVKNSVDAKVQLVK